MKRSITSTAAVIMASFAGCASRTVPAWFELTEWEITVPGLGSAFDGFRILHLTDIHYSEWMDRKKLMELKAFVLASDVDLIAMTGDSSYHTTDFQDLCEFYTGLDANAPVLMTWGNHDVWDNAEQGLTDVIGKHINLLSNERFLIERGQDRLCIVGLDCAYEERDDLGKAIDEFPAATPGLMLAHEPDIAEAVSKTGNFFLQLSGHSHGGQICLPNGYAPILPWLGQRFPRGYYDVGGMMLYTSRGLGRGKPFIRVNCPAEAEIFTLYAGNNPAIKARKR